MEVETHIPVPKDGGGGSPLYVQHLRKLEPGQSMFFPDSEFPASLKQIGIGVRVAAMRMWGTSSFTTRTMDDPKMGKGVRIWRLS